MENNQPEENEKEINIINENENISQKKIISEEFDINILKDIFNFNEADSKIEFLPILNKSKNLGDKIISLFEKPNSEVKSNSNLYHKFIINRIELFNNFKIIIGNHYEIFEIIINYLRKNNIYPIFDIIEICIELIFSDILEKDNEKQKLFDSIKNLLKWLLSGGLIHKSHTDFIFQKLSKFNFQKKLTLKLFDDYLSLIELIFGKEHQHKYKKDLIAKNYVYFYDTEYSIIKTNISKINSISINESCSIIIWFYINQEQEPGNKICSMHIEGGKEANHNIELSISENFDINVKFNSIILMEQDDKKYSIKRNKWAQLKIQISKNVIKLFLCQDFEEVKDNEEKEKEEELENKINNIYKYDTKVYYLNNKKSVYSNNINAELLDYKIINLNFLEKFLGYAGTIIFCKKENPSKTPIKSLYGLKSNKISNFMKETALSEIFFIK